MSLKVFQQVRYLNSKAASITRPHRPTYARLYPTLLVRPDGSTITIRYHEPRQIIKVKIPFFMDCFFSYNHRFHSCFQLPPREDELSEAERKAREARRKPKQKVVFEDDIEDDFDSNKYLKYLQKQIMTFLLFLFVVVIFSN